VSRWAALQRSAAVAMALRGPRRGLGPGYCRRGPAYRSPLSGRHLLLAVVAQALLWLPDWRQALPGQTGGHHEGAAWIGGAIAARPQHALRPRTVNAAGNTLTEAPAEDVAKFMMPAKRLPGIGVLAVMRAVSMGAWLFACGFVFLPSIVLLWPFVRRRDPERRSLIDVCIRIWSRFVVWPFFKVRIEGLENLPPSDQACVYVANHQSFMDILSALHLSRSFKFISKASIFKIPMVGWAMRAADHVGLKRDDRRSQVEVFRKSVRKLQAGASLFIFPEGTRSKDGVMLDFKAKGAFSMARRGKAPLVPITILGTGRIMPGGKEYFCYPSRPGVRIVIHKPVSAKEVQEADDKELIEHVRKVVASGLPEAYRGAPSK